MGSRGADFTAVMLRKRVISPEQLAEAQQLACRAKENGGRMPGPPGVRLRRRRGAGHGRAPRHAVRRPVDDQDPRRRRRTGARSGRSRKLGHPAGLEDDVLTVVISDPLDLETIEKLRFILNRRIETALATREAIQEAINRHYGQIEGESADSMLQEFTDTAIDFTETEEDISGRRGGRREQRPRRPVGATADPGSRSAAGFGHPRRAVRGSRPHPLPDRRHADRTR